jgi:hypothetical protein
MDDGVLSQTPSALVPERLGQPERMLNYPSKLLPGPNNQLFIADTGHHRILEVALQTTAQLGKYSRPLAATGPAFKMEPLRLLNLPFPAKG